MLNCDQLRSSNILMLILSYSKDTAIIFIGFRLIIRRVSMNMFSLKTKVANCPFVDNQILIGQLTINRNKSILVLVNYLLSN